MQRRKSRGNSIIPRVSRGWRSWIPTPSKSASPQPYPQILYWLAMPFTTPVPREAVEYYDDGTLARRRVEATPTSSIGIRSVPGPSKIVDYEQAHRFRLIRNPDYRTTVFPSDGFPPEKAEWLKQFAGQKLPMVDEIEWPILRETSSMWLLARLGYFDGTAVAKDSFGRVVSSNHDLSPDLKARGMSLEKDTELSTFFISFNCTDPVLANKNLRKALACAYNAQGYVDIFKNGVAPVATQLVPPGIFGHLKDWVNPNAYNLERARQLIAEAGYPNGIDPKTGKPLELTMDVTATGSEERQTAEYEQRQLRAARHQGEGDREHLRQDAGEAGARAVSDRAEHGMGCGLSRPGELLLPFLQQKHPARGQERVALCER